MNKRLLSLIGSALLIILAIAVYFYYSPLWFFAHQIAGANKVVIHRPLPAIADIVLNAEESKRVVPIVSSGYRDSNQYKCYFGDTLTFHPDNEMLGEIQACTPLYKINGIQYQATTDELTQIVDRPFTE